MRWRIWYAHVKHVLPARATRWDTSGQPPSRWRSIGPTTNLLQETDVKRNPRKDPVTPDLRLKVIQRDMARWMQDRHIFGPLRGKVATKIGCVAAMLDPSTSGPCFGPLTLDHVKDEPMMGKRAPSDEQHLVTICLGHHIETGWATANRPSLRWYLRKTYGTER